MRKITQKLMFALLLLMAGLGYSQKVAVIGMNHVGTDGFTFLVTQDLASGEVIYFTENEYVSGTNAFNDQTEGIVQFTAGSAILKGNVVFINETASNTYTVTCTSGGCGTAAHFGGAFALATDGDSIYAYTDNDTNPTNGITTIYSVMYSGTTEPTIVNGGAIATANNPVTDYPNAIVVDGFPGAPLQPNRVEFNTSAGARTNVNKLGLENPSNYVHAQTNVALSTTFFTNFTLASANPVLTVSATPGTVNENSGTGMVYTFSLSANAASNITVNFTVGGSAVFGTDYTQSGATSFNATTGTITIPTGSSSASMTLTPTGDAGLEPHESITITLAAGTGYDIGSPGAATTNINNDDTTNNEPMFALVGTSHTDPDGFSFVAVKDVPPGTVVYFTDNSFNNNTLLFGSGEAVVRWTSPGTTFTKGNVVVITETATDVLSATCSGGSCGTVSLISGNFALATTGETMYAYSDNDTNPSNGVTDVYAVLFTGTSVTAGGTIPTIEDPSTVFLQALVVDGFPTSPDPARTEYNPAGRNVLVTEALFENPSSWVYGQGTPALSTTPFANLNLLDSTPPTAICQNISVTPNVGTGSVTITASQIDNGSTDNVGIASLSVSPSTFTCANVGTPVTVTLTVTDTSNNVSTCTATVTVLPNTTATFTQVGPICSGDSFTLPTTSNNGITGTWAPVINNTATTTYIFTPNTGQCASATASMTVVVNPSVTPTFTQVAPICSGDSFSLPTTSTNGVTGTWSPAIDNTQTTTYTFTPDLGQCAATATMTVVVNPNVTPTFTQVAPICAGATLSALPTTSNNGVTGTWAPAIDNTTTTTYTFTPDAGQCATTATMTVVVNPLPTTPDPTYTGVCEGGILNLNPNVNASGPYTMNPNSGVAFIDIDATGTQIGGLGDDSEHNITIPAFTFNGVTYTTARVSMNGVLVFESTTGVIPYDNVALPTNDIEAGTAFIAPYWDDLDIQTGAKIATQTVGNKFIIQFTTTTHNDFTTGFITFQAQLDLVSGEITYVYQDVDFGGQPAYDAGASATVGIQFSDSSALQYSFNTASLVNGQSISFYPPTGLTYAWTGPNSFTSTDAAPSIPNVTAAAAGTYSVVVTDVATGCQSAAGAVDVTIDPLTTPTFTQVGPVCQGDVFTLPATSDNSITGTWSPAVDNSVSTTYTFTPDAGQCATTATMTVVVNPNVTPTFTQVAAICAGDTITLPTTSDNGITGTWSPAIDNTATTTYTFTPDAGQCAATATMTVVVNPLTSNTTTISACDSYTWSVNATTYTTSGQYQVVTGCHTEILDLTINVTPVVSITPATGCVGEQLTLTATVSPVFAINGFSGALDISNWVLSNPVGGSVNTTNAPSSIAVISGNNGQNGNTNYSITVPNGVSTISFNWSYTTVDGANWDRPQIINNGVPSLMTGYDTGGSSNQSGTMTVNVVPGQTFALSMLTVDGLFGSATVTISNFVAASYAPMVWTASNGGTIVGATDGTSVTVTTSGTYTLTSTNGTCIGSDSENVIFNAPVTPTFDPVATQTCPTSSPLPTTSNNGYVGNWSPGFVTTPGSTTTYTFTPNAGQCATTATATVTIAPAPGDPTVFGNNVWNVYAWNAGGTNDTGSSWNTNYSGYYTIPTVNFDTQNQWCNGCSPSDAAGYLGCAVSADNHSWSAKRKGFPSANYSIDITGHDDEAELWVNGVMVWEHLGCCDSHAAVWQGNLSSSDTVEFRSTEGVGGSFGSIVFNVLPNGPASLTATYCGATLSNNAVTLVSNYVQGAQMYRFRVTNVATGAVVGIVDRPVNSFALSNMPGITLATTYMVDVTIRVNNVWSPFYGSPCTVTTPTPAATIGAQCGTTLTSMGQWIYATYQPTVTAYRFRITNLTTNAVQVYDPVNGLNKFNFTQLPASFRTAGTVYSVEVSLRNTDGTYLPYGTPCNVTTPGTPPVVTRTPEKTDGFVAIVYPNPYAENFMFDVRTTTQSNIQVLVYDMLGKQIENRSVEANQINGIPFGANYPSGVYNIVLTQGETTQTLRIIKR